MRNLILVGLVMLGIGFAIGWVAKPAPPPASMAVARPEVAPAPNPPAVAPMVDAATGKRTPRGKTDASVEEVRKQAARMQAEMSKTMVSRLKGRFETRIERLAESLDLTAAQKSALAAWMDGKLKDLETVNLSDPAGLSQLPGGPITDKGLDTQLAATLGAEQKEGLEAFQERERSTKVDTVALKNLTKLQGVIQFEEGQRDEVYKILSETAREELDGADEQAGYFEMFSDNIGVDTDPYGLGIGKAFREAAEDGGGHDPKAMAVGLRERIHQRIDEKIEDLRPVLNERQLELYRAELETKGLGVYGPMLKEMERGGN